MVGPVGNALTPACTPLHVYKLVYLILQDVFRNQDPEKWPFILTDDFDTTTIGFDTVYNRNSNFYGKKPIVIVTRGPQSTTPVVLGDLGAAHIKTMNKVGSSVVRSSVEIKVVSKEPEEADIIGQHVFNVLQFCRVPLAQMLSIVAIDSVAMSHVAPIEQEDHMFFVSVSMTYQIQYKWTAMNPEDLLSSIANTLNNVKTFEIS